MNNNQDKRIGMCAVCGTVHVSEDGFDTNRGCTECGEWMVYSMLEYRDIAIDWVRIKEDFSHLLEEYDA